MKRSNHIKASLVGYVRRASAIIRMSTYGVNACTTITVATRVRSVTTRES